MTQLKLNGQAIETTAATVLELLTDQGLTQGRFAVEIDGILVPKSRLADTPLANSMTIEVVQAVGGG